MSDDGTKVLAIIPFTHVTGFGSATDEGTDAAPKEPFASPEPEPERRTMNRTTENAEANVVSGSTFIVLRSDPVPVTGFVFSPHHPGLDRHKNTFNPARLRIAITGRPASSSAGAPRSRPRPG